MIEFSANTDCTHGTLETLRRPYKPMIFLIGHFESPTELQRKKFSVKEFLASKHGTLGTLKALTWPYEPIIFSVGHFKCLTEVQLNS